MDSTQSDLRRPDWIPPEATQLLTNLGSSILMLHFVNYIDLKPVQIQRQMIRLDFWIEVDEATLRISM